MRHDAIIIGKRFEYLTWTYIMTGLALIPYQAYSGRGLCDDGAEYFFRIINTGHATGIAWSRGYAEQIHQLPTLLALNVLHVRSLSLLLWVFTASQLITPLLSLLICYRLLRDKEPGLIWLPLLSYAISGLNNSMANAMELNLATQFLWPLFFFYYTRDTGARFSTLSSIFLIVASFVTLRLYESFSLFGLVLIFQAALLMYKKLRSRQLRDALVLFVCGLIYACSVGIAAYWILYPRDPENRQHFLTAILAIGSSRLFLISLIILLIAFALYLFRLPMPTKLRTIHAAFVLGPAVLGGLMIGQVLAIAPGVTLLSQQYPGRIVSIIVPLVLVSTIYLLRHFRVAPSPALLNPLIVFLVMICFLHAGWQLTVSSQYRDYLRSFESEIAEKSGTIDISALRIGKHRWYSHGSAPIVSILLQIKNNVCIKTIIKDTRRPSLFDPDVTFQRPRLSRVNASYCLPGGDGLEIDMGADEVRSQLTMGWAENEHSARGNSVWALGKASEMTVALEEGQSYTLKLYASAFVVEGRHQTIKVYLNRKLVGELVFDAGGGLPVNELMMPKEYIKHNNTIRFEYAYAVAPISISRDLGDTRQLSVNFDGIVIEPHSMNATSGPLQ
jgi:hypothetical protein